MSIIDISIFNRAIKLLLFIGAYLPFSFSALTQNTLTVNGMEFNYIIQKDSIYCQLSAPTKGWLMIGFNNKNSVDHADLKFFAVHDNQITAEDRINIGGRNYPSDLKLGGQNNIYNVRGSESLSSTEVSFTIPLRSGDKIDYEHHLDSTIWLILAYSVEDDFLHHSRMRKHLPFKWEFP